MLSSNKNLKQPCKTQKDLGDEVRGKHRGKRSALNSW